MGYSEEMAERYNVRKREVGQLKSDLASAKAIKAQSASVLRVSDDALSQWIEYLRKELQENGANGRQLIRQFIEKIVLKEGAVTLHYTFPLPNPQYISSLQPLDLGGGVPYTRHKIEIPIPPPLSTISNNLHPDKDFLRQRILELRNLGWSYRAIGEELQIHFTTVRNLHRNAMDKS